MFKYRKLLRLIVLLLLLPVFSLAEDSFLIDVDALDAGQLGNNAYVEQHLSAQAQGIRVRKYISDSSELAASIRLTIAQSENNSIIFDKNYGYVSGTFDSGNIYLPYVDNNIIPYLITLQVADTAYSIPFLQKQARLNNNKGCTFGVRLQDYASSLSGNWQMGTMLDLDALRSQGSVSFPICASNLYIVGQATVSVSGDQASVSLSFDQSADVQISSSAVYLVGDVSTISSFPPAAVSYSSGQSISIQGLHSALLYIPLTLSYDPTGLEEFHYDLGSGTLSRQLTLWNANLSGQ